MEKIQSIGLICEEDFHYIDHLAPLCSLLQIPLLVTNQEVECLVKRWYPEVVVYLVELASLAEILQKEVSTIYYCFTSGYLDLYLGISQLIHPKAFQRIWVPHGYSEKNNYEGFQQEKEILIYGTQMRQRLEKYPSMKKHWIRNYRLTYFCNHLFFYREALKKQFASLDSRVPTLLYAPTWEDRENSSSFPECENLFSLFPKEMNLIVKFHPNTYRKKWVEIERLKARFESQNLYFLQDFPPIYPLLEKIDGYIGDPASSVGYDMLFFLEKPLFFLPKQKAPLQIEQVGFSLPYDRLKAFPSFFKEAKERQKELHEKRKNLYLAVFT